VVTDGRASTIERVRTQLELAFPGAEAQTGRDLFAAENQQLHDTEHLADVALLVTLLIAGCSLAVSVAGGLVERKRPFALLRLAGVRLRELHRVVFAEAAAPLLIVSAVSVALGFAVDAILVDLVGGRQTFHLPTIGFWVSLVGGLACALAIVAATLPLLDRVTSVETARFE
jgi:predicted lysophospholipase L1 biosynthesis ABC-type transport system permease subunit